MANTATNYKGKGGKVTIVPQGQTAGVYGSTIDMQRRAPSKPKQLNP